MEHFVGDLVYYNFKLDRNICVVLDKAMGVGWACLGKPYELNSDKPDFRWFYHIRAVDNPHLFYGAGNTNKCGEEFILQYNPIKPTTTNIKKHKLV